MASLNLRPVVSSALLHPCIGSFTRGKCHYRSGSIPVILALPLWFTVLKHQPSSSKLNSTVSYGKSLELPWQKGKAWMLAVLFGMLSFVFYSLLGWLPLILSASWAAMTQCIGFLIGASGPFLTGYLHDRMGHFNEGILGMVFISIAMVILSLTMMPRED